MARIDCLEWLRNYLWNVIDLLGEPEHNAHKARAGLQDRDVYWISVLSGESTAHPARLNEPDTNPLMP